MKYWTCVMCGCPSNYDFCLDCEAGVVEQYQNAEVAYQEYVEQVYRDRFLAAGGPEEL